MKIHILAILAASGCLLSGCRSTGRDIPAPSAPPAPMEWSINEPTSQAWGAKEAVPQDGDSTESDLRETLVGIAKAYIGEYHPNWKDKLDLPPVIENKGSHWQVSFELPPDLQGGTPVVEINKRSLKVIRIHFTQ